MCKYISSVASVLNFIRLNFWIVLRKQVMERSITKCFICKHVQRKTLLDPKTRSLPGFCIKLNHISSLLESNMADQFISKQTKIHVNVTFYSLL